MNVDVIRLRSGVDDIIKIDQTLNVSSEYLESADIIGFKCLNVNGIINKDSLANLNIDLEVSGIMILPCAVTLKPVDYPFNIKIEGNLEELLEEINENAKKIENTIDIFPIIWENILMEIPMRVVSEEAKDAKLKGNGWELVDKDVDEPNCELQKLKDLL